MIIGMTIGMKIGMKIEMTKFEKRNNNSENGIKNLGIPV